MIQVAKTIKKHWAGVLRWFVSRISNGVVEAINSLIQSANRSSVVVTKPPSPVVMFFVPYRLNAA